MQDHDLQEKGNSQADHMITISSLPRSDFPTRLSRLGPKESAVVLLSCGANTRVWGGWKKELQSRGGDGLLCDGLPCVLEALTEGWAAITGKVALRVPEGYQIVAALGLRDDQRYQRSSNVGGCWGSSLATMQRPS